VNYLLHGLNDEDAWVQYDAAWAANTQGLDTPEITQRLRDLAEGYRGDETVNPSDPKENLKKRAAESLATLSPA
jgi:hypothetical protein